MKWGSNVRLSIRALSRSWLRTALSISGVAIGIASVVILIGAGQGAERTLRDALEQLGRNLLVVNSARTASSALRGGSRLGDTLLVSDWKAIAQDVPGVLEAVPVVEQPSRASFGNRTVTVNALGTTAEFATVRNYGLVAGRFLDPGDLLENRRVAVVGTLVVDELFLGESPLGEWLQIGGVPFCIVGVTGKKGISPSGNNEDEFVFIPVTTAMRRLMNVESLTRVFVQAVSEDAIPSTRAGIADLLRERHGTTTFEPADFSIQDQTALVRAQQQTGGSFSRLVTGLSALALGLGGVGLLAVALLGVRERYSEIGLRLAVGGRPRDILLQFFTEAVMVAVLGGGMGVAVGAMGILIGSSLTRWPMMLSWQTVAYPLGISVAIAVIFGSYPALRAARLDPVQALNSK